MPPDQCRLTGHDSAVTAPAEPSRPGGPVGAPPHAAGWPGLLPAPALAAAATRAGVPGLVPVPRQSLAIVPDLVLAELAAASRGVIVLGVDGLPLATAARCWHSAALGCLTSTFPTASAPAWLTALTGADPGEHGVPGMVYRLPGRAGLVLAITGRPLDHPGDGGPGPDPGTVAATPLTVFERAAALGARTLAVGRELDALPGPWAAALLRGAAQPLARPGAADRFRAEAADPAAAVRATAADIEQLLARCPAGRPALLWGYLNLDDYLHRHGPDGAVAAAAGRLDEVATGWADRGWTVLAHSDHGQVRCVRDPDLERAWAELDTPRWCELPGGGAGRVRWLHPRPGRAGELAGRLAAALGDAALVLDPADLDRLGLLRHTPAVRERLGTVVAVAATDRFPPPDPALRWEHGSTHPDEMLVPLAAWRP